MVRVTHYIPPFTRINGRKQEAVCGSYVKADAHSVEPTCTTCAGWLVTKPARDADEEETARALEVEFPEYAGRLATETKAGA